jgi:hypothetical protein
MSRFSNLADKSKGAVQGSRMEVSGETHQTTSTDPQSMTPTPPGGPILTFASAFG